MYPKASDHLSSYFLNFRDEKTLCPCNRCENTWLQRLPTIRAHILRYGMLETYQRWIHHGESLTDEEEDGHFEDSSNNDEDDHALRDAIVDEEGRMFSTWTIQLKMTLRMSQILIVVILTS